MRRTTGKAATITNSKLNQLFKLVSIGNHAKRNHIILSCSHFLGLRSKELASLLISDVVDVNDNLREILRLKANYTKGEKHRDLPLTNVQLRKALQTWINYRQINDGALYHRHSQLFKSQKGFAFSANTMARMINNIYQKNGFENCRSHTGRRSMITKLANKGVSINKIKIIAGHCSISTTMEYIDTNPNELSKIMKAL